MFYVLAVIFLLAEQRPHSYAWLTRLSEARGLVYRCLVSTPSDIRLLALLERKSDVPKALEGAFKHLLDATPPSPKMVVDAATRLVECLYEPGGEGASSVAENTAVGKRKRDEESNDPSPRAPLQDRGQVT